MNRNRKLLLLEKIIIKLYFEELASEESICIAWGYYLVISYNYKNLQFLSNLFNKFKFQK